MRAPLTPLKAFVHDAAVLGRADSPGSSEDPRLSQWLMVAQAAERLAGLPAKHREEYAARLSGGVLQSRDGRPTQTEGDGRAPTDVLGQLAERIRLDAEDMERAGCFELARTTVSFVCQMLARAPLTNRLLATAHLGRVNRQLGELAAAVDCYSTVTEQGQAVNDGPVAAHGFIGLGNVANARGNRPQQKAFFERALGLAAKGSQAELSAHQGLMDVATVQNQLADALLHGWRAHDLAPPNSEVQVAIVGNLAHTAFASGFYLASLAGSEHVLSRSRFVSNRLASMGTYARAAARLGRRDDVLRMQSQAERELSECALPFETARLRLRCAEAWLMLGEFSRVETLIAQTLETADQFGFHELRIQSETLLQTARSQADLEAAPQGTYDPSDEIIIGGIGRLEALAAC